MSRESSKGWTSLSITLSWFLIKEQPESISEAEEGEGEKIIEENVNNGGYTSNIITSLQFKC